MMTGVNLGLIQYWFANKGGMEQHVLALAEAMKYRKYDIRVFLCYPIDSSNEYVAKLFDHEISAVGSSPSIKDACENQDTFRYLITRFVLNYYCVYIVPFSLIMIGLIKGRRFRSRAVNTWKFMKKQNPDRLMLLSSALKLCVSHCYRPLDIVHVNGFRVEVGWAIRWADQFSVPSIYTEHSTVTDWLDFEGMDIDAVKLADAVASVSNHACEELRNYAGLQYVAKLKHILPVRILTDAVRLSSSINDLVCVAELKRIKRVGVLVEAFSIVLENHPDLKLHIVGDGPERTEISNFIEEAGISRQVCLHGSLSNREVNRLLQKSDLMILPSLSEGMPVSILEALSNSVPVIASDKGGIPEIVKHGENGFLFSLGDSCDIANTIKVALEKNAQWKGFSYNARHSFEAYDNKNFSAIDEVIDLYEQAVFNRHCVMNPQREKDCPNKSDHFKLSVVIPTHNPKYIDQTLSGLAQQIENRFEVLIVENGSSFLELKHLIEQYSGTLTIHYFHQHNAGLNSARNHGVVRSGTEIVALIDDDAVPNSKWTKEVLHSHRLYPDAGVIGGPVKLSFLSGDPGWICAPFRDALSEVDYGEESRELNYPEWLAGTNFSFRKQVFHRAGAFLEDMGPSSENNYFGCNDETEFLQRANEYGIPGIYYNADMEVVHLIPDTRVSLKSLEKRFASQGYSDLLLTSKHQHDISWRNWWKFLYHALEADKWHKRIDDLPASLPTNILQEFYKNLVMTRIAFLEGMLQFILNRIASPQYVESLDYARKKYQKQGKIWLENQRVYDQGDHHHQIFKNLSCLMLKRRWTWSLSDRFTEHCVFGRIYFLIEIKNRLNEQIQLSD